MIIGAQRLIFQIPSGEVSPKALAQRIKDHLWHHFKVSVAETEALGTAQVCIGLATVGNTEQGVREKLQGIVQHLHDWGSVELVDHEEEVIHYNDIELERDFEKYEP